MNQPDSALDVLVVPRTRDLGDGFEVRRALPSVERRMVGPFVFLDQMGPHVFTAGSGLDVRPHPHIGLATLTYLFDGEILHRDSLGSVQPIRPGEVNWMTAGRGIVHSERTAPQMRQHESSLFGLQCWVALPRAQEETDPDFVHVGAEQLPLEAGEGVAARIVAGSYFGRRSPVPALSDMVFADITLQPGATVALPPEYDEQAVYVAQGQVACGADGVFDAGRLLVLKPGAGIALQAAGGTAARVVLVGGEPMDGPRYLTWNFVSSSPDRIEQAKDDWRQQRFAMVPGESEFIPLPDLPGRPVHYP
ncbi:pirin family protein [Noviherbaspirillum sp. UKPF54]|uniref:pirin family protein n=1 Tax=Noviherbaspirillum sp. UKPF54 TaxID=2601898 RepID=UPI0011B167DB|nr:pirin family protein [Noviherbaspirillum sp. UKPF54]QDZ29395.1 pirin family protein [Noviherbaspirillum sp. UKPF54]